MPTHTQQSEATATEVVKRHNARSFVHLYWALERLEQIYAQINNQFWKKNKKQQPQINKEM